jgi:HAD superfamily hydrolase (TIGR01509 family)
MPLRALIWDVDGTLAETERDGHLPAFNAAFEAQGVPWRWSVERYGELLPVTGGYERMLHDMATQPEAPKTPAERERLARSLHLDKNERYAQIVAEGRIPLRDGVRALMDDCRAAGVAMAIATTTSRSNVDALLAAHLGPGWREWFACVLCGEDAPRKKPDPQVYTLMLERLGLPAGDVLAVEDSPVGVRACVAAGVPVIVTRSVYFAEATFPGACAVGPGLAQGEGWSPAAGPSSLQRRIDLDVLQGWLSLRSAEQRST